MESEALENAWFATRYQKLSPVAEKHLRLAGLAYADDAKAEMHLVLAKAISPNNPVVQVGEYRYYFYKNRLKDALKVAEACLNTVSNELAIPNCWSDVMPEHADFRGDEPAHRFYLFVLKAYAYLLLRLGRIAEGTLVADKLLELDPDNKIGGQVLLDVVSRIGMDDYDD
jgi:tetratricopeptide (TPR) repeat protein